MSKTSRKRKGKSDATYKINKKNKDPSILNDESEKENLAEVNNNITIVRLSETILNSSEEDEDDCEWENVSELDDRSDIIVNIYDEDFNGLDEKNDEKRIQQRYAREMRECIHKTILMSLIGRALFINRILCNDGDLIAHLAVSCLPHHILPPKQWNELKLRQLFDSLLEKFEIKDGENESGNVKAILFKSFNTKRVSSVWINVLLVVILRCAGIETRLIAAIYPGLLKKSSKLQETSHGILCPPTMHKPSTRGGRSKNTNSNEKKKFSFNIPTKSHVNNTILFTLEVLDTETHQWIPVTGRNSDSWNDLPVVIKDHPRFLYCLAFHNDGSVKDLAAKYDMNWATISRRQRLSETSFSRIFEPLLSRKLTHEDRIENAFIKSRLIDQGVPSTLADLKGHPVFVLKSHLLKYEVLYPDDVAPFGWLRKEEVFLRDNVRLAHTKETWLKEAKVVRPGEIPCKKVKTLSSRRRQKENGSDPFVELFGPWQVENYTPPTASNGVVPKNIYGNVDLFMPSMLPFGCTHLQLKDLDKISIQLGIDCVPAMVGWVFTKRNKARPIYDGWVVCNEYVETVKAAWMEFHEAQQAKLAERRRKIVIKRWEMLTRRLLLKERLKLEYNF